MIDTAAFVAQVLADVKNGAKGAWDSWSADDRALVTACAKDAAEIALRATMGQDVRTEKAQVDAQLANIKVATAESVSSVIWGVLGKALKTAAMLVLS